MPRREFELTTELFKALVLHPSLQNASVIVLSAEVDHRYGVIRFIVEDPNADPLPEGHRPRIEAV